MNTSIKIPTAKIIFLFLISVYLCIVLTACGKADISTYANEEIIITGLTSEEFSVTPEELINMKCISCKGEGASQKSGTIKGYGPTLTTFVEAYGESLENFSMIQVTASDDYVVFLAPVLWDAYDVILSVSNGSEPLEDYEQPVRIVIPGAESGNWIRMVKKMEFVRK